MLKPRQAGRFALPQRAEGEAFSGELLAKRQALLRQFLPAVADNLQLNGEQLQQLQMSARVLPALGMIEAPATLVPPSQSLSVDFLVWEDSELPPVSITEPTFVDVRSAPWHRGNIGYNGGSDGTGVKVGVIDYGYDPMFPDLWDAKFNPPFAVYDDTQQWMVPAGAFDPTWTRHGSKVCAMLAGQSCGVARGATYLVAGLIPINPPDLFATSFMMVKAIEWLMADSSGNRFGCDIITTSLNTTDFGVRDQGGIVENAMLDAQASGALVVAAIGNGGGNNFQEPGAIASVIGVGAVDEFNNVAGFSATGPNKPDMLAPGAYLQFPDGYAGHILDSGTSFAAPIVAGAAALYLQNNLGDRYNVRRIHAGVLGLRNNVAWQAGLSLLDVSSLP